MADSRTEQTPQLGHLEDEPLFPGYAPPAIQSAEDLSPDRRRTIRQQQDISNGKHPLTGGPLHPEASKQRTSRYGKRDPFTCGSCYFREVHKYHDTGYPKCWFPNPAAGADAPPARIYTRVSHGAASDVRAWWPACPDYSPGDRISPDAARSVGGVA